eukprot:Opistho-1_new@108489
MSLPHVYGADRYVNSIAPCSTANSVPESILNAQRLVMSRRNANESNTVLFCASSLTPSWHFETTNEFRMSYMIDANSSPKSMLLMALDTESGTRNSRCVTRSAFVGSVGSGKLICSGRVGVIGIGHRTSTTAGVSFGGWSETLPLTHPVMPFVPDLVSWSTNVGNVSLPSRKIHGSTDCSVKSKYVRIVLLSNVDMSCSNAKPRLVIAVFVTSWSRPIGFSASSGSVNGRNEFRNTSSVSAFAGSLAGGNTKYAGFVADMRLGDRRLPKGTVMYTSTGAALFRGKAIVASTWPLKIFCCCAFVRNEMPNEKKSIVSLALLPKIAQGIVDTMLIPNDVSAVRCAMSAKSNLSFVIARPLRSGMKGRSVGNVMTSSNSARQSATVRSGLVCTASSVLSTLAIDLRFAIVETSPRLTPFTDTDGRNIWGCSPGMRKGTPRRISLPLIAMTPRTRPRSEPPARRSM